MTAEDKIQHNIVKAVRLKYPRPKALIFAVPNGGWRSKLTAAILKATGVLPGVSDLIFLYRGKIIFVEVKTEDGQQSPAQKEFQKTVTDMGFQYWIVRSASQMLARIEDYNYSNC